MINYQAHPYSGIVQSVPVCNRPIHFRISLNIDTRKHCEYFGFIENHEDESILLFHSCSTNIDEKVNDINEAGCNELHIGNTPRSIMTRLNSLGRVIEEIHSCNN